MSPNRRTFLKSAAAGAALGMASATIAAQQQSNPAKKWKMRLSASSICFMELPVEQACEKIASLGFEAVDIWSAHQGCPHLDDVLNRLGPEALKSLLKKLNLKLYAFSTYSGGYRKYAELLGKAGGGLAVQGSAGRCKPEELSARMKQFHESLKPLAELAEQNNSHLAIENHGNALLDSLDSFKAFVDTNKSDRIGIALAPYHIQAARQSVPEAIRICGKQLMFFYAWQNAKDNQQLPAIGPTDMKPWLEALAEIDYRGYVDPFMHGHPGTDIMAANLAKSRDYLMKCYSTIRYNS